MYMPETGLCVGCICQKVVSGNENPVMSGYVLKLAGT